MPFSFSGKKSETPNNVSKPDFIPKILTMEDDLRNISSGASLDSGISDIQRESSAEIPRAHIPQAPNPFQETELPTSSMPLPNNEAQNVPEIKTNNPDVFSQQPPVKMRKGKMLMLIGIVAITIALIGGGVYYYLFVVKKKTPSSEPTIQQTTVQSNPQPIQEAKTQQNPVVTQKKDLLYTIDTPNYLPLNTEVVSDIDIYNTLSIIASRIKDNGFVDPVEFLITDQTNTPLALSRFVFLTKMNIDTKVLALLDESFALFIYNDAGTSRIGLRLSIKDPKGFTTALTSAENVLPLALKPIFLSEVQNMPKTFLFKSGMFKNEDPILHTQVEYPTRYTNVDATQRLSVDYAIVGDKWYIGTSQNTLQALLKKVTK